MGGLMIGGGGVALVVLLVLLGFTLLNGGSTATRSPSPTPRSVAPDDVGVLGFYKSGFVSGFDDRDQGQCYWETLEPALLGEFTNADITLASQGIGTYMEQLVDFAHDFARDHAEEIAAQCGWPASTSTPAPVLSGPTRWEDVAKLSPSFVDCAGLPDTIVADWNDPENMEAVRGGWTAPRGDEYEDDFQAWSDRLEAMARATEALQVNFSALHIWLRSEYPATADQIFDSPLERDWTPLLIQCVVDDLSGGF